MLSRVKGQTSGSRPEAAGLFPPNVFGAREGSVNRSWWAVRNAKDAATIRPTKIPATRARLTRIRAAFPFAYIWGRGTRWSLHPGLVKSITDDFWRSILHDNPSLPSGGERELKALASRNPSIVLHPRQDLPRDLWLCRSAEPWKNRYTPCLFPAPTPFRWSADRGAGLRRYRVGHRGDGARHDHDARAGLLLWRLGPAEEPRLDDRPVPGHLRGREFGVVLVGIHARLRPVLQRLHRKLGRFRPQQRRGGAETHVLEHDSRNPLFRLSTEVRRDHAGLDHRRLRGADPLQVAHDLHRRMDDLRLRAHRPLELGPRRMAQVPRGHRLRRRSGRPHGRRRLGGRRRAGNRPEGGHRSPG